MAHSFLPYYYSIKGKRRDGYTYVLYLNGGHPTWGALDYIRHVQHSILMFREVGEIGVFYYNNVFLFVGLTILETLIEF